jgi:hypothetical protein
VKRGLLILVAATTIARGELADFTPVATRAWLTGPGAAPLMDPGLVLPVYLELPARAYRVLGYVRVIDPAGDDPRRSALQVAAATGRRHGGDALILITPVPNVYAMAAVIRWL